jgi:paraquat-inducible protein B
VFSSGNLFSQKQKFILYFEGSMKGMAKGAPVQFKGVTIGSVLDVYIAHNQATNDYAMPVIIEIDHAMLKEVSDRVVSLSDENRLKQLISRGMRGRLDAASFVTGVLMVQLDFLKDPPPAVYHQIKPEYIEIPTAATDIQILLENIGKIDFKGMTEKLNSILDHLDTGLKNVDVKAINDSITNLLASVDRLVDSPELTNSLASLHRTLDDIGSLAKNIDTNTLAQVQATLTELRTTVQGLSTTMAPDAPLQIKLTSALDQLSNAARSIAELTEFLKRNPNALITGRTPPKEKQ